MAKLYEITGEILELKEWLENEPDSEIVRDTLEALSGELDIKAEGYCKVLREFEGHKAVVEAEIDRLVEMKRADVSNIDRLKKALFQAMHVTGRQKIETGLFKLSVRNNAMSLDQIPDSLPERYLIHQEPTVDKRLLLADIKNGIPVDGVTTKQTQSLIIK